MRLIQKTLLRLPHGLGEIKKRDFCVHGLNGFSPWFYAIFHRRIHLHGAKTHIYTYIAVAWNPGRLDLIK